MAGCYDMATSYDWPAYLLNQLAKKQKGKDASSRTSNSELAKLLFKVFQYGCCMAGYTVVKLLQWILSCETLHYNERLQFERSDNLGRMFYMSVH